MIIGLDVGGTHTDAVLLDCRGVVERAKVSTDETDLFRSVLAGLDLILEGTDPGCITRIVLSTTLTTNAIVRNRVEPVGMIVCSGPGLDPEVHRTGPDYHVVAGAIDHRGREIQPVDPDEIVAIAAGFRERGIRQVAVVGKFSCRNPAHEVRIAELVEPYVERVFMGHRTSGHLSFPRRIATTFLNASVYPIHRAFFEAVGGALREKGLSAPVHIMKADGGTMSLEASIDAPGQTVLSGPAASIMGAIPAAPAEEDVVVLDIGGTTTDIAILVGGVPLLQPVGIAFGRFKTLIRSLQTSSIGIGGDSHIQVSDGQLAIGPDRCGPPRAFGGPEVTPTDAFVTLGELNAGDAARATAGVTEIGERLGLDEHAAAQTLIETACDRILAAVDEMVEQVNAQPVYTIHEMLDGYRIRPTRLLVLGGPAEHFAPYLAARSSMKVSLVPDWGVANAIGAAMARTTCEVSLVADTERGLVSVSNSDAQWRCDRHYTRVDALRQASEALRNLAIESGADDEDMDLELTEDIQFNIVNGFSTTGRNIRVSLQIKPGLIHGYRLPGSASSRLFRSEGC
ncbi:Hydantoinase/oxoprolinase [Thiorhodococcus drewsii AZ1]|uniref:Hydantoinase/oxoprolinase n=1 Tax=Thiorhodococcus drewsii AZ1 TaxID=765913 RepID=G2E7C9_9GAMM|nr:hydantoinase/oxoprolinase family protein [Thiorhodococcus drewsii]EGV27968.1 Hydantoinase/oxoprolinase [Thiorhodococcus drewsii AZ1]